MSGKPDLTPFLAELTRLQAAGGDGHVTCYFDAARHVSGLATVYQLPADPAALPGRLTAIVAAVPATQELQITATQQDGVLVPCVAVRCFTPLSPQAGRRPPRAPA